MVFMKRIAFFLVICIALGLPPLTAHGGQAHTVYRNVDTEERIVAITFDDGPHPRYTAEILDLLAQYDAKATFFVIGKNLELYGDLTRRAAEEGHEIGNHTYTHSSLRPLGRAAIEREITESAGLIERCIGRRPDVFRPPGGAFSRLTEDVASKHGEKIILWSVDTRDWAGRPSAEIVEVVMRDTVPGSIILFHDYAAQNSTTVAALKEILPRLSAAGYRFVTVSELILCAVSAGGE